MVKTVDCIKSSNGNESMMFCALAEILFGLVVVVVVVVVRLSSSSLGRCEGIAVAATGGLEATLTSEAEEAVATIALDESAIKPG